MQSLIKKLPVVIVISLLLAACSSSELKNDEMAVFFPTSAYKNNGAWEVQIHNWVFEKEEKDLSRIFIQKTFEELFEALGETAETDKTATLLKQRLKWFLVDNQSGKTINIKLNEKDYKLNQTASNGHANTAVLLDKTIKEGTWLTYQVEDKYQRDFSGEIQFIPEVGLSVISDIDDTIKVSNVLDKKELVINVFLKTYSVTKGFPEYYKQLENNGAYFHYVSASPWQLYPSLKPFMDKYYPKGTVSMRNFRLKDSSLLAFFKPSSDYKITQIKNIIQRYPKHQFILIGDSGEHDPEVYAKVYQQFPKNIQSIQIRVVEGSDLSEQRFTETFKHVPKKQWSLFSTSTPSPMNKKILN